MAQVKYKSRDELEKELRELNESTCKTCKYCKEEHGLQPDGIGWQTLECQVWDGNFDISPVYDDGFGCNKWEKR